MSLGIYGDNWKKTVMSLGAFDKLTPEQQGKCQLLEIEIFYFAGEWVIRRFDPHAHAGVEFLFDMSKPDGSRMVRCRSFNEAINTYINRDKGVYAWL